MVFGQENIVEELMIDNTRIENVIKFVYLNYLGSLLTWDYDCSKQIKIRIARAIGAMAGFKKVWNSMYTNETQHYKAMRNERASICM